MRWKTYTEPKLGDTRERTKFAWLPVRIGDIKVWLETYLVREEYRPLKSGHCWHETGKSLNIFYEGI